ncbi:aldose 1-epimerase family protein [Microbacterium sp. Kw_RZR3]|uniref:aldose 1-epimerase family protein n=1 Tax=Microbacterium sp. Kw_RZR3 TaxID=3032903 RepID=UPI0023D9D235|nr:aldose 1-epimerase family protein [Microbacterium sp. Kw_RZR3]MDF2046176.1 aldose 1-epimerase family protein [Microbacterium sp. Kw_RZR3]
MTDAVPTETPTPVSGTPVVLRAHGYEAAIASVGASLRSLTFDGRDLVVPFAEDEVRPAYRGTTLAPWPNRVVDGIHRFGGDEHQLALTEPNRAHALHGLLSWVSWNVLDASDDAVTLTATVPAQAGYPWWLVVSTTYRLDADGLTQTVRATNLADTPAPWGTGPHPYLVAGPATLYEWTLELPADTVLEVTADRLAPVGLASVTVDAERFDFREPRVLGAVEIDHAYTALIRDAGARATVTLTDPSGTGVAMSWDESCPWVQIHTADLPAGPGTPGHRAGLAVEPMTCAPDAFNDDSYEYDTGLIALAPGASSEAGWTISAR